MLPNDAKLELQMSDNPVSPQGGRSPLRDVAAWQCACRWPDIWTMGRRSVQEGRCMLLAAAGAPSPPTASLHRGPKAEKARTCKAEAKRRWLRWANRRVTARALCYWQHGLMSRHALTNPPVALRAQRLSATVEHGARVSRRPGTHGRRREACRRRFAQRSTPAGTGQQGLLHAPARGPSNPTAAHKAVGRIWSCFPCRCANWRRRRACRASVSCSSLRTAVAHHGERL
jgi:hypothetical protein